MSETVGKIMAAMSQANKDITAVDKSRSNKEQGFKFRGIDEVYNEVHDCLAKNDIFVLPRTLERTETERMSKYGTRQSFIVVKVEFDFMCGLDGSKVTAGPLFGEALDISDKGTNKAMSFAIKTCLLQVFTIPTQDEAGKEKDGDNYNEQSLPTQQKEKPAWAMLLEKFAELRVGRPAIEARIGGKVENITPEQMEHFKQLYHSATTCRTPEERHTILSNEFGAAPKAAPTQQPQQQAARGNSAADRLNSRIAGKQ